MYKTSSKAKSKLMDRNGNVIAEFAHWQTDFMNFICDMLNDREANFCTCPYSNIPNITICGGCYLDIKR